MTARPPFERYPAPPRRDGATLRVISPWRDALAWVSLAGRLAITRYLVREGEWAPWRDGLPETGTSPDADVALWTLVQRDPVEIEVATTPDAPVVARASVQVTREACEVRVTPLIGDEALRALVAVDGEAIRDGDGWRIVLPPQGAM